VAASGTSEQRRGAMETSARWRSGPPARSPRPWAGRVTIRTACSGAGNSHRSTAGPCFCTTSALPSTAHRLTYPRPEDDFLGSTDPCAGRSEITRSGACDPTSTAGSYDASCLALRDGALTGACYLQRDAAKLYACGFLRLRTGIPIDRGQSFQSIADSIPMIADSSPIDGF
jgi:hypothetical protein